MSVSPYNYLKPNAFRMLIKELPNVSFTCQSVNVPAIISQEAVQPTPFIDIPRMGDKLSHGDLIATFIVQERFLNYIEIYNWLVAIGFPRNYDEFSLYTKDRPNVFQLNEQEGKCLSDINISILSSDNTNNVELIYRNCFPKSISDIQLDVRPQQVEYVTATVTFAFTFFDIMVKDD